MSRKFDSRLIHGGSEHAAPGDGVAPAYEPSSTFVRGDPKDDQDYIYGRLNNPNRDALEKRIASIEGGSSALAFASGSAASMTFFQALPEASHIIVTEDAYYGTVQQLKTLAVSLGHEVTPVGTFDIEQVKAAMRENTRLLWIETPSNPQMRISDIQALSDLSHEHGAITCCDNTIASSVMQRPLQHGADYSMHSSSKYFGGHSDVIGGVLIAKEENDFTQKLRDIQMIGGAVPSPFDCWLLLRSISTLGVRVRAQSENALRIAKHLQNHKAIEQVLYAGLGGHEQQETIDRQMTGGGALMSFIVRGTEDDALRVAAATKMIKQATSLGGIESLIEHRRTIEGSRSMCSERLLRLSVGLEDTEDLIADLKQALANISS